MEIPEIVFSSERKPLKVGNKEYISAIDFSLKEEELQKARIELFETDEHKIRKLQELRDKLADDEDANYRTDTEYLLRFLRVRKYDSTKAYKNIKEGYIFKKKHPEIFSLSVEKERLLNQNIFRYLPYTDEQGHVLFHLDLEKWNCQEIQVNDVAKVLIWIADIISMNPRMQVNGVIGIWDMKGLNAQHVTATLSTFSLSEMSFAIQNLFPWRVKRIVILNTTPLLRLLRRMIQPFLSKKVFKRFVLLGSDIKELHQYVDPAILPRRLGGLLEENQCSVTQNVIDNLSFIKYNNSFI